MTETGLDILLVDDDAMIRQSIEFYLKKRGHRVVAAATGEDAVKMAAVQVFDMAFVDVRMPGINGVEVVRELRRLQPDLTSVTITGHADLNVAVEAMRAGAQDLLKKPIELAEIDAVLLRRKAVIDLQQENRQLRAVARRVSGAGMAFLGESAAARRVREQIAQAAAARCDTVLITGETGSGKEVAAFQLHSSSARAHGPFVPVNCPAIPGSLLESELFGHRRGAFTGATEAREGCFEIASGGTLFLDEIADLPAPAQAALLRAVETRRVRRVGGGPEIAVDLCLVAATNQDLEHLVETRVFRQDLFYRLNVFSIHLPPLRERRADIPLLAAHFLELFTAGRNLPAQGFSAAALAALTGYPYPGNVRELRNLVERAAAVCQSEEIGLEHLTFATPRPNGGPSGGPVPTGNGDERTRLLAALEETRWNRRKAADLLGISYSTLREKIAKYALG